ncbi:MAG: prolipoprotein diacylglyceryl transferase [Pseudomonadota bacterium]|mgnify:CR=1 FL=1
MIVLPAIDPVAVKLGPLAIHWYGLMYLLGFYGFWWLGVRRGRLAHINWPEERVNDFLFAGVLGVILGGRIGYTLFYNFSGFISDPLVLLRIWEGGMSFHGGCAGVIIAIFWFGWRRGLNGVDVGDFATPMIPFGLFTGRIGNFINSELWGAPSNLPWAMVFPNGGPLPRHPSMLYEAALEGLLLLAILLWFGRKPRPRGAVSGLFLSGYAVFRIAVEFVRLPDDHIGYLYGSGWITMGMMLSLPMLIGGLGLIVWSYTRK